MSPPFQWQAPPQPYVNTIGDLLRAPGYARADAAQTIGEVQARAALQSGQAWGNAIQQVGQAVGSIPERIQQQKAAEQAQQLRDLQIRAGTLDVKDKEKALEDQQTMSRIYQAAYGMAPSQQPGFQGPTQPGMPQAGELPPGFEKNADGVITPSMDFITKSMAAGGLGDKIPGVLAAKAKSDEALATLKKTKGEVAVQTQNALGLLASQTQTAIDAGVDPKVAFHFSALTALTNESVTTQQLKPFLDAAENPANIPLILKQMMQAPESRKLSAEEMTAQARLTGATVPKPGSPDAIRAARIQELSQQQNQPAPADVNGPQLQLPEPENIGGLPPMPNSQASPAADQMIRGLPINDEKPAAAPMPQPSAPAASRLTPGQIGLKAAAEYEQASAKPSSLEEQLLTAIVKGDTKAADQIKSTLQTAARARQDPAAVAQASELRNLNIQQAQERLDAAAKKNEPLDVSPDIHTTASGRKYIDLSTYSGEERNKARKAAADAGAVSVSKEQANALQEIDNARSNQQSIMNQIGDLLPKNAAGRIVATPGIVLSRVFQTNDQIAAFNSWRTAAIQTLRATAGSKGLRINEAEISQAIANDIPKLNDTWGAAQQKVKNINTMLENAEKSILVMDRGSGGAPGLVPTMRFNPATGQLEPVK